MKYQSEIIREIVEQRGHDKSSLHYQSECIETWIEEAKGGYPKLTDYQAEWLNYISILDDTGGNEKPPIGEFPYVTLTDVTEATVDNVVPYAYMSAILKGMTLANLASHSTAKFSISGGKTVKDDNGFFTLDSENKFTNSNGYYQIVFDYPYEHNKDYTVFEFVTENTLNEKLVDYGISGGTVNIAAGMTGVFVKKINATYDDKIFRASLSPTSTGKIKIGFVLLEGDYTNVDIPYFNGMQSIKMPVLKTSNEDGTKTIILTVNEDVTLRGIGGVRDELDLLTGKVTERIIEFNFNQNYVDNVLSSVTEFESIYRFGIGKIDGLDNRYVSKSICDRFKIVNDYEGSYEHVYYWNGVFYFFIEKSKIEGSVDAFKTYITNNPIKFQTVLATESIKTVDLTITDESGNKIGHFKPIEGTMLIQTDGEPIKPTVSMEIPVEAINQNLASFIELEMEE